MLMRLINASATWQRFISHLFQDLLDQEVVIYLDDILIYTKQDSEKHRQLIEEVLKRLIDNKLYVDINKIEFHAQEVEFLEHIVGINGIRMNSEKVRAVRDW